LLDKVIAILEIAVQPFGNYIADRGLARSHWTDENDVALAHAGMITAINWPGDIQRARLLQTLSPGQKKGSHRGCL
jgi:hypothetical protein